MAARVRGALDGWMIGSLDSHLQALYRLRRFGIKLGLGPMSRLMRGLGDPHRAYPSIHVAGTNGKGSIAAMIAAILCRTGYKVGLYTSPHLIRFNERIQINGRPVSEADVIDAAESVGRIYTQSDPPTFFECATAMAFYLFARENVDWAVLETGMGGRFDATNVVRPQACVISNIGMEHTEYLGKRLTDIAGEKAGIIKPETGVITGVRQKAAFDVIAQKAAAEGVPLRRLGKELRIRHRNDGTFDYRGVTRKWEKLHVGLPGDHQTLNAGLALGTLEFLQEKGLELRDPAIYAGLEEVSWPGRLEIVSNTPFIMLDGAHNLPAVGVLKAFLKERVPSHRLTLVVGILQDKAWKPMLRHLATVCDHIILTRPEYERAGDPEEQARFLNTDHPQVTVIPRIADACAFAIHGLPPEGALCITGSLYTVGEAKAYLEGPNSPCRLGLDGG